MVLRYEIREIAEVWEVADSLGADGEVVIDLDDDEQPTSIAFVNDGKPVRPTPDLAAVVAAHVGDMILFERVSRLGLAAMRDAHERGLRPSEWVKAQRKQATRRKPDPEYLRGLAKVYRANPDRPAKAIEEWAGISPATATRHIGLARSQRDPKTRKPYLSARTS